MSRFYVNPSGKLKELPADCENGYLTPEDAYAAALDACRQEDRDLRQRRAALNRKLAGLRLALTGAR